MSENVEGTTTPIAYVWSAEKAITPAMRNLGAIVLGSALLTLSAYVQVPFWPVKMSMQSFAVILIGLTCGSRLGAAVVLAYLAQGAVGLPVFQSGAGLLYMTGPTGGFLAGFVLSAFVVGVLVERGALARPGTAAMTIAAGIVVLYAPGIAWLAVLFGWEKSVAFGLVPFIPAELFKMALALVCARLAAGAVRRRI